MKKKILQTSTIFIVLSLNTACATSYTWLDDGSTVHAQKDNITKENTTEDTNTTIKSKTLNSNPPSTLKVTLATGVEVTLVGGVYVKAKEPNKIVDWAEANGYEVSIDKYRKNSVHIKCIATKSIEVANAIAKLDGVTTAAPKYKKDLITK